MLSEEETVMSNAFHSVGRASVGCLLHPERLVGSGRSGRAPGTHAGELPGTESWGGRPWSC